MSEKLATITGGSNDFATRLMGSGVSTSSGSFDIIITPPAGQRVRLTHLSTVQGVIRADITVIFGTQQVLSNVVIAPPTNPFTAVYSVGSYQNYQSGLPPFRNYEYFTGETDEALTLRSGPGTSGTFYYGYQFGE